MRTANRNERRGRSAVISSALAMAMMLLAPLALQAPPMLAKSLDRSAHTLAHDVHLTYSRMVVDGASVACRVRLFKDDLDKALRSSGPAATTDSLFAAYFNAHVTISSDGHRLSGRVVQSGRDLDVTDQEMWWFQIEASAARPITTLTLRVALFFDLYKEQKNLVTLLKMPG
ncbi:MAG: hypothetical protein Q8K82_08255 [Gemmatimonadaceae bacterium]|nr:hypothetical protein [Gemmatimonadaceae bacterium]